MTDNPLISYGWAAPSESLYKVLDEPVDVPEDCPGPHRWERGSTGSCGGGCCDAEKYLECGDCLHVWHDDRTPEWQAVWNLSDWG